MANQDLTPIPISDLDAVHAEQDPTGYGIQHRYVEGGVLLQLFRLADGEVIGEFDNRGDLDAAAVPPKSAD